MASFNIGVHVPFRTVPAGGAGEHHHTAHPIMAIDTNPDLPPEDSFMRYRPPSNRHSALDCLAQLMSPTTSGLVSYGTVDKTNHDETKIYLGTPQLGKKGDKTCTWQEDVRTALDAARSQSPDLVSEMDNDPTDEAGEYKSSTSTSNKTTTTAAKSSSSAPLSSVSADQVRAYHHRRGNSGDGSVDLADGLLMSKRLPRPQLNAPRYTRLMKPTGEMPSRLSPFLERSESCETDFSVLSVYSTPSRPGWSRLSESASPVPLTMHHNLPTASPINPSTTALGPYSYRPSSTASTASRGSTPSSATERRSPFQEPRARLTIRRRRRSSKMRASTGVEVSVPPTVQEHVTVGNVVGVDANPTSTSPDPAASRDAAKSTSPWLYPEGTVETCVNVTALSRAITPMTRPPSTTSTLTSDSPPTHGGTTPLDLRTYSQMSA